MPDAAGAEGGPWGLGTWGVRLGRGRSAVGVCCRCLPVVSRALLRMHSSPAPKTRVAVHTPMAPQRLCFDRPPDVADVPPLDVCTKTGRRADLVRQDVGDHVWHLWVLHRLLQPLCGRVQAALRKCAAVPFCWHRAAVALRQCALPMHFPALLCPGTAGTHFLSCTASTDRRRGGLGVGVQGRLRRCARADVAAKALEAVLCPSEG